MLSKNLSVLLVESDPVDAKHIIGALQEHDPFDDEPIEVRWVRELSDSLTLLDSTIFDAVMIDLSLPDGDGIQAVRRVRELHGSIPIVAVAGEHEKSLVNESMQTGAQDFILKLAPGPECVHRSLRYAIERKKAETLMDELSLLQQRDTFVAMLAHDLRNPLIGCDRILSLLIEQQLGDVPEEQLKLLSMMKSSHKGLLLMIANVLDCYRLDAGPERIEINPVNISALVADCLIEMSAIAVSKSIRMFYCFDADIFAQADETAMRRVITNLLSNALKFTPSGGEIRVHLTEDDGKVSVNIEDTGKGIPAEEMTSLFQKFFQCQKRDRGAGLGIGLNICKRLMDAQNGSISCSSEPGIGSIFCISLPAVNAGSLNLKEAAGKVASAENSFKGTVFGDVLQPFDGAVTQDRL